MRDMQMMRDIQLIGDITNRCECSSGIEAAFVYPSEHISENILNMDEDIYPSTSCGRQELLYRQPIPHHSDYLHRFGFYRHNSFPPYI